MEPCSSQDVFEHFRAEEIIYAPDYDLDKCTHHFHDIITGGGSWDTGVTIATIFGCSSLLVVAGSLMLGLVKEYRDRLM